MVAGLQLTCVFLLALRPLLAQPYTSRSLSIENGLPEFYVTGLLQDKAGFVWIATRDGLARYDGRQFKIFRHQPHRPGTMTSNIIASLQAVSDSIMLVQLEDDGFMRFNTSTEQFSELLPQQRLVQQYLLTLQASLTPDGGTLWGRQANQLIRFKPHSNTFSRYPFPATITLPQGVLFGRSFVQDAQSVIYAPYPGGLLVFNPHTNQFRQWLNPAIVEQGAIRNFLQTPIIRRATGELLIGGVRQLVGVNPQTGRFRSIPFPHPLDTKVGIMHAGVDGNVYFTYAMTVYRLTPDDRITPLWTASRIDYQNYFHALLLDRSGVLWVGTNGDGVQQIDLQSLPVDVYPYQANFIQDVLTRELGMPVSGWASSPDVTYRLRWGGEASYAVTRYDGHYHLLRLDGSRRTLHTLLTIPQPVGNTTFNEGNGLRVLPGGTIWMMDIFQGLLKVDTRGRIVDKFPLPNDKVSDIQPLGPLIWIGSEVNGLYAYDPQIRRIVHRLRYVATDSASLVSNHVWCLAADPHNPALLWVGTQEGLGRLDTRTMRFTNWTQKQGLPNATIHTLLTDRQGQLWFSTLKGVSRMNPRSGQMRHFTTADGLLDIEYKPFLGAQLPDGRLAFGGVRGVTTFNPAALKDRATPSIPTVLTALKINNEVVEPGPPPSTLSLPLNATRTLQLGPTQNFVSLEFAGLQYNKPTTLQYRYQLKGVDADWVYVGNQTVANYTQLAPGHYEFRVNAGDALGNWSPLVKTIRIQITPPWWQTWWFYLLSIAVTAALLYLFYRYRQQQQAKVENIRNRIARDLHDEVGSSISSVAIYSKALSDQLNNPLRHELLLQKISQQATEIMESMNDIVWNINTKNDSFDSIITRMREQAYQLLEVKGYILHFDFEQNVSRFRLDMGKRREFYLIYKEALNNIAKYANGKHAWITIHVKNSTLTMTIRDDGQGFDRHTIKPHSNGLANMKHRAAALGGALRVTSTPGEGTIVELSF